MNAQEAIRFVEEHGILLESAKGPVPRLTEVIAGAPIKGSWWSHPKSRTIFRVLRAISDSEDILICRLIDGKITYVHRRLWPALARLAKRFPADRIARVHEEHTASGRHVSRNIPFPEWVPAEVLSAAKQLSELEATEALGKAVNRSGSDKNYIDFARN